MANIFKAIIVTLITIAPVLAKERLGTYWNWNAFVVYALCVFLAYWRTFFKPDARFERVRTTTLDNLFEGTFHKVKTLKRQRFPFRVNVYRPYGVGRFSPILIVGYTWRGHSTDPDRGKWWWCWCGLAGRVYWTGKVGFTRKGDDLSEYRLTKRDELATNHIHGLLCLPLRRPSSDKESVSGTVTAVLAIDALSKDAADVLEGWYNDVANGVASPLPEKAAWLSLFF